MKPVKRRDKISQLERRDVDRQARERILERHLHEALAKTDIAQHKKVAQPPAFIQAG